MAANCNYVKREGRCDGQEWIQCTYCGAIDSEFCKKIPLKTRSHEEMCADSLEKALSEIKQRALAPYEIQSILIYLLNK